MQSETCEGEMLRTELRKTGSPTIRGTYLIISKRELWQVHSANGNIIERVVEESAAKLCAKRLVIPEGNESRKIQSRTKHAKE